MLLVSNNEEDAHREHRRLREAGPRHAGPRSKLQPDDKTLDRASVDAVMNEIDEYAVEEALQLKEAHGGEVTVLTMGPERAAETIRKALSMGADKAVHVVDDALHGSDALATSYALAKALEHASSCDLVILGVGVHRRADVASCRRCWPSGSALPQLTFAAQGRRRRHDRHDRAADRLRLRGRRGVDCPPSCRVVEKINEPRYPSFKGIMAAKKKPVETLDAGRPRHRRRRGRPGRAPGPRSSTFATAPPRAGRGRSSRTRATAAASSPSSSRRRSSSDDDAAGRALNHDG